MKRLLSLLIILGLFLPANAFARKWSDLTAVTTIATGDIFATIDVSATPDQTKRITWGQLMAAPGAIGGTTPATGVFTALTLSAATPPLNFIDTDQLDATDSEVTGRIHNIITTTTDDATIGDMYFQATGAQGTAGTLENFMHWDGSEKSLILPLENDAVTPSLAIGAVGTGFYGSAAGIVNFASSGILRFSFAGNNISANQLGGSLVNVVSTSVLPALLPKRNDPDSGSGHAVADGPSMVAGGVEAQRWTEAARTIESNATVCATDGGDLQIDYIAAHGLMLDDTVSFAAGTGALCAGIVAGTIYYVSEVDDNDKINIAASRGGATISWTDNGTAFTSYENEVPTNTYGDVDLNGSKLNATVRTFTTAQINAMRATPLIIVPAQGANTWIELVSAIIVYDYATAAFTVGGDEDLVIEYADGTDVSGTIETTGFLDQGDDELRYVPNVLALNADIEATINQGLRLLNSGSGETADGGGEVDVRITYRVYATGL